MNPISALQLDFTWLPRREIDPDMLAACAELYSQHYGIWSAQHPEPSLRGKRIRLSANHIQRFLQAEDSWIAFARCHDDQRLIAYAIAVRSTLEGTKKKVTWVTQLVVHDQYRHRGVAKRLLSSLWGFSDDYAWGLVTANPFAVRALEKASRRRCDLAVLQRYADTIYQFGQQHVGYTRGKQLIVDAMQSTINTKFYRNSP